MIMMITVMSCIMVVKTVDDNFLCMMKVTLNRDTQFAFEGEGVREQQVDLYMIIS